ncbi:small acid-soluble spore protein SspI [Paenalkalicoccus suaedae]|uniref:Small, acid-soluble spore protein I n=1 Tax=Paenalkalicoccus suaedae TaxID=2592382 RepID=A0A859FIE5_9BACI|nr:small acid-soluble spore protein SspI [Paenalkalicoccus suaedae]QKS72005.1 small acid-soluble spore protein SspI [Paenalkalicoccus suaedae]
MSFALRPAILANIQGNSNEEVEATIVDAISRNEEKMLPGLGVMMELLWQTASEEEKATVTARISEALTK